MADEWSSDLTITWAGPSLGIVIAHPVFSLIANSIPATTLTTEFEQVDNVNGDTESRTAILERTGLSLEGGLGNPARMKLITAIYPVLTGPAGVQVTFSIGGELGQPGSGVTYQSPVFFTIGTTKKIDCLVTCKYAAIKLTSTSLEPIILQALGFEFEDIGQD